MTRDFILMAKFRLPQHNLFSIPMAIIIFVFYPMALMLNIDIKSNYIQRRNIVMTLLMIMFILIILGGGVLNDDSCVGTHIPIDCMYLSNYMEYMGFF
jgi:hypothetical protein